MAALDWYFDFVSPFPYLQLERMGSWPAGTEVRAHPVLFAGLLDHWGNKGPGEIPSKRIAVYRLVQWLAEREGIPLRFPPRHPFNPLAALRLAIAADRDLGAIRAIYRHIWAEGNEIDTARGWDRMVGALGLEAAAARIGEPGVKEALRREGEGAIAAGVFGVPSVVVDGQLFWGFDSTEMVGDYLRRPERFRSGEMARLQGLPVGVARVAR